MKPEFWIFPNYHGMSLLARSWTHSRVKILECGQSHFRLKIMKNNFTKLSYFSVTYSHKYSPFYISSSPLWSWHRIVCFQMAKFHPGDKLLTKLLPYYIEVNEHVNHGGDGKSVFYTPQLMYRVHFICFIKATHLQVYTLLTVPLIRVHLHRSRVHGLTLP